MACDADLDNRLKRMALVLGWMLVIAGALWFLVRLWPIAAWVARAVSPFLVALVVAYLFHPIVSLVQKRLKLGRVGGMVVVAALILLILVGFFGLLLPVLYGQTRDVFLEARRVLPGAVAKISQHFGISGMEEIEERFHQVLEQLDLDVRSLMAKLSPMVPRIAAGGLETIQGVASGIGLAFSRATGFLAAMVMVIVISFYYLLDFHGIPKLLRLWLPARHEERTMEVLGKVDIAVGGFLRGQLIVCLLVAAIATVGLAAIGMWRYALVVGVIAGVANIVPYLGPVVGATPGILWALCASSHTTWSSRLTHVGLVVAVFVTIQVLDGLVFQPRIVGKSSNLHPLIVLLALATGAKFGLGGMILAVPLACIARVLFKELWWDNRVARKQARASL